MEQLEIRRLTPNDTEAFLRLRREALETKPLAFAASVEDDRGHDPLFVRQSLAKTDGRAVFGAFLPELGGMIGIYRDPHRKKAHNAHIWGMYVQRRFQRLGVGAALLTAAIQHARELPDVSHVQLSVSETAEAARRLYEKSGFRLWGTEPESLRYDGRLVAEHHLVLVLG